MVQSKLAGKAVRANMLVIVGGILQENPFYTTPGRILSKLRNRGGKVH
jgi:hypothetical protein